MSTENNQSATDQVYALTDKGEAALAEADAELLSDASEDPCMPIRNLAGHLVTCNYGDWADFTKCKCAEGLLTSPEQKTAFVVAPMPLRDILASSIQVSDEMAHELAMGIRAGIKKRKKIHPVTAVLGVEVPEEDGPLTVVDLAAARAKIRYLEADAMLAWRTHSLKINAEAKADAERAAKAEVAGQKAAATPICVCNHDALQHGSDDPDDVSCALPGCDCTRYKRQADAPRIIRP